MEPNTSNHNSSKTGLIIGLVILAVIIGGAVVFGINRGPSTQSNSFTAPSTQNSLTATSTPSVTKSYTLAEVAAHGVATDCWMVIEGKVYNVTDFVLKHPGGPGIVRGCGKDATTLFNERPTNNNGPHPAQARSALPQFYIGDLRS